MRRFSLHYGLVALIAASLFVVGCDDDGTTNGPRVAEKHPRMLQDQYQSAAKQARLAPHTEWKANYDVPLDAAQTSRLDEVIEQLKTVLATRAQGGPPEISHLAMQTGKPDNVLLVKIWFAAQLAEDAVEWRYELTLVWHAGAWTPSNGTAQHGTDKGRELNVPFVADLIGSERT